MANPILNVVRLARAGLVMAEYGVRFVPPGRPVPLALHLARILTWPWRAVTWPLNFAKKRRSRQARIAAALTELGPSYIKLGQFLATRRDLVGAALADDLSELHDRLPPFSIEKAHKSIENAFAQPWQKLYRELGPPIAAASIAQVHKACVVEPSGESRRVAVKVLRPNIERRFKRDLDSFYFAARQIERFHPPSRRLRPVAVVDVLARSMQLEMDLRLEAAAISEMAENIKNDEGFRVPGVDWARTSQRVLTLEWIDATAIDDVTALRAAGHDLTRLGTDVIRHFLRHAMRDGFFHADMHQGNLLVEEDGTIVAVDFGIMGRLTAKEQRFLAEILYGFLTRDYRRAAEVHFWAGYVPSHHSLETFAQALRAIGEPLMDRTAEEISMGHLLGQLFEYTDVFDMKTRPELIMLQKTMVVVEGVARTLDPAVNIWTAAEPIVRDWLERQIGIAGRLRQAQEGAGEFGKFLGVLPGLIAQAERSADAFAAMARDGIRLEEETLERMARKQARRSSWQSRALWVCAFALAAIALHQWLQ